jgi:hypothetical protein
MNAQSMGDNGHKGDRGDRPEAIALSRAFLGVLEGAFAAKVSGTS